MRWIVVIGVTAVSLVLIAFVVGVLRPASHVARTRSVIAASAPEVWSIVSSWEEWPQWQPEITEVERLADRHDHPLLLVTGGWGAMTAEIVEWEESRRMVTVVDGGAFRGRWTYELEPTEGGTVLTLTEEGEVSNPLFRAMMIFHDNYQTMLAYHVALGERLGIAVTPERLE